MARGSAVIKYEGKRGAVWRVKFHDATGRQVMETLGRGQTGGRSGKRSGRSAPGSPRSSSPVGGSRTSSRSPRSPSGSRRKRCPCAT